MNKENWRRMIFSNLHLSSKWNMFLNSNQSQSCLIRNQLRFSTSFSILLSKSLKICKSQGWKTYIKSNFIHIIFLMGLKLISLIFHPSVQKFSTLKFSSAVISYTISFMGDWQLAHMLKQSVNLKCSSKKSKNSKQIIQQNI